MKKEKIRYSCKDLKNKITKVQFNNISLELFIKKIRVAKL